MHEKSEAAGASFKLFLGFILAFLIGSGCRLLDIPLPAPTALLGAFIVMSLTTGYLICDRYLATSQAEATDDS